VIEVIAEAAFWVQIAGFGLPVAANAVRRRATTATATAGAARKSAVRKVPSAVTDW
jgi:hypothetical protein